ncbi:hypothetical protein IM660_13775 [Ruania alkalisoli]|uniref:DUF7847 domain-containing protein n=1 Tax=Ruania alkalisoli TaxID=2779775 RepID=A0A7M1SQ84_9MICO|nr:hypothetical protein [Ruania alkalisoli]QOR69729.1 hypothetical protein IM660_13775 [Ruania alkalisoli]
MSYPGSPPPQGGGWGAPDAGAGWGAPNPGGYQQQPPQHGQQQPPQYGQQPGAGQPPMPPGGPPSGAPGSGNPGGYGQFGPAGQGGFDPHSGFAPQPGVIPLRPLTLGELYDGAIRSIRANPAVMFALTAVLVSISVAIQGVATWGFYEDLNSLMLNPEDSALMSGDMSSLYSTMQNGVLGSLISSAVSFLVTTILTGLLIHSVSQSVIGRKMSLGEVWAAVRGQILRLLGLSLLIGLMLTVVLGVAIGLVALAALTQEVALIVIVGLLSLLLAVVGVLVLLTFTLLATPALVLERAGILTALRRSFTLTRRAFWRILGIYLLTQVLVFVVASAVSYPIGAVGGLFGSLTAINIASLIGAAVTLIVTTPFVAAVTALLYIDVRIRTEALDVELARAAQGA